MPTDISDLRPTIIPKSDQLNADQLIGGPMTITVTDVRVGSSDDQPISVHYQGDAGRPFKPCKTMRKVLIFAWGPDGREWIGRSMTVYNDPQVRFGGAEVGGIRISHMTDIERDIEVSLTATKGKKSLHRIRLLKIDNGPALADVLELIGKAHNKATLETAKALAAGLRSEADQTAAAGAYRARVAAIKVQHYVAQIEASTSVEAAQLVCDEASEALSAQELDQVQAAFEKRWPA